jgi:hypothetical protein
MNIILDMKMRDEEKEEKTTETRRHGVYKSIYPHEKTDRDGC